MTDKKSSALATADEPLESQRVGRSSGIPAIELMPWGTHFCQFYDTKQDLWDTLVPYFRAGLESNERCVWVTSDPVEVDEAAEALGREVGDLEQRIASGQMSIMRYVDWYGDLDRVDPEQYLRPVLPSIEQALAQGFAGRRACGNVSRTWLQARHWKPLMATEVALGRRVLDQRALSLCIYPLGMCDSAMMIDVLLRHRYALIKHDDWTLIEPSAQKRATAAVERMNAALAERTAELQAALADLRGFSRWVTHDLRAPLRSVRGFSDLLAETAMSKLDDDERHLFERIQARTDRMDNLITDIMAYSTAQQNVLSPELVDLAAAAREAWDTLTDVTSARRVHLQIQPMPPAYGDQAMLTLALTNLLGNAIKFTGRTTTPGVVVGARIVDGENVYFVRDNGIGFDQNCAEKIFGAFERLHGKAEYEGNGLGLAIVKQIIGRHGGRIWAESTPGAGATFSFTLPAPSGR